MLFVDALPVEVHMAFGRIGLAVTSIVAGATFMWLEACMAEMYSRYQPPEKKDMAGFVTLSSYHKCTDFLFFQARAYASILHKCDMNFDTACVQMMKSFYAAYTAWRLPGHAVFLQTAPERKDVYARFYEDDGDGSSLALTQPPGRLLGVA